MLIEGAYAPGRSGHAGTHLGFAQRGPEFILTSCFHAHAGAWGCHTITRCIQACPKNVRPTDGIEGVRRKLIWHKFKKVFAGTRHED